MSILAELRASTSEGPCYLHRIPVFTMQLCSAQTVYLSPRKSHQQNPQEIVLCEENKTQDTSASSSISMIQCLGTFRMKSSISKTLRTWRIHEHRGNSGRQAIPSYLPSLSLTWHFNDLAHFICSCSWTRLPIAPTAAFTSRNSNFLAKLIAFHTGIISIISIISGNPFCISSGSAARLSICFYSSPPRIAGDQMKTSGARNVQFFPPRWLQHLLYLRAEKMM